MLTPEERDRIVEEEALRFHTRRKLEIREMLKRSLLISLIIVIVAGSIVFLTMAKQRCWFQKGISLSAMVDSASTLRNWASVKCLGIRVGTISRIKVNTNTEEAFPIELRLFIPSKNEATQKIKADSSVRVIDPFFGTAYLDIKPGSPNLPEIQDNDVLRTAPSSPKETIKDWLGSFVNDR
jgi:ABC-type transporter Mla subunit MlaD